MKELTEIRQELMDQHAGRSPDTLDAWGPEHLVRMDEHHRAEHREIAERVRAAAELPEFRAALDAALPAIDELMAHMREEEREFLGKDLLRDDVINIQQSDG